MSVIVVQYTALTILWKSPRLNVYARPHVLEPGLINLKMSFRFLAQPVSQRYDFFSMNSFLFLWIKKGPGVKVGVWSGCFFCYLYLLILLHKRKKPGLVSRLAKGFLFRKGVIQQSHIILIRFLHLPIDDILHSLMWYVDFQNGLLTT